MTCGGFLSLNLWGRDPDAQSLIRRHHRSVSVQRALGTPWSEIKEEPKAGDIRGGEYPVSFARTLNKNTQRHNAERSH